MPALKLYGKDDTPSEQVSVQPESGEIPGYLPGDLVLLPAADWFGGPHLALIYDSEYGRSPISLRALIGSRRLGEDPPIGQFPGAGMRAFSLTPDWRLHASESLILSSIITEVRARGSGRRISEVVALALIGIARLRPDDLWWISSERLVRRLIKRGVYQEVLVPERSLFPVCRVVT